MASEPKSRKGQGIRRQDSSKRRLRKIPKPKRFACSKFHEEKFEPRPHQELVMRHFLDSSYRGLLLFHELGTGKTCSSIHAIDQYRQQRSKLNVYIITPASLREGNFVKQYCEICGSFPEEFKEFQFLAYDDPGVRHKLPRENLPYGGWRYNLDDSIIVVDEVHRLINGKRNTSENYSAIYDAIAEAKRSKVILLSGTPIYRGILDFALIMGLIKPGSVPGSTPFEPQRFYQVSDDDDFLRGVMEGVVSFVPIANEEEYPRLEFAEIEYVPMSQYQFSAYSQARMKELEYLRTAPTEEYLQKLRRTNYKLYLLKMGMKYVYQTGKISKTVSNFAYPADIQEQIQKKLYTDDLGAPWITEHRTEVLEKMKEYSPKLRLLLKNVLSLPGKHQIYTFFEQKSGASLIYTLLDGCGVGPLLYTGKVAPEVRARNLTRFNHPDNINGDYHKVIIMTLAGSVGLNLTGVRHVHLFDSEANELLTHQIIGRARRWKSHHLLPLEERVVVVHRYLSILPLGESVGEERSSIDENIYEMGKKKLAEAERIMRLLKEGSIDCEKWYRENCYHARHYDLWEEEVLAEMKEGGEQKEEDPAQMARYLQDISDLDHLLDELGE